MKERKVLLAIAELEGSIALDPSFADAYRALGVAYMTVDRKVSAVKAFERFVALAPEHKDAAKIRAIIAESKGEPPTPP